MQGWLCSLHRLLRCVDLLLLGLLAAAATPEQRPQASGRCHAGCRRMAGTSQLLLTATPGRCYVAMIDWLRAPTAWSSLGMTMRSLQPGLGSLSFLRLPTQHSCCYFYPKDA